jgi:hypothetical protein
MTRFEISSDLNKIAAGAQRKVGDFIIHQGSIKLNGVTDCPAIGQVGNSAIESESHNKKSYNLTDSNEMFCNAFDRGLSIRFEKTELKPQEIKKLDNFLIKFDKKILLKR